MTFKNFLIYTIFLFIPLTVSLLFAFMERWWIGDPVQYNLNCRGSSTPSAVGSGGGYYLSICGEGWLASTTRSPVPISLARSCAQLYLSTSLTYAIDAHVELWQPLFWADLYLTFKLFLQLTKKMEGVNIFRTHWRLVGLGKSCSDSWKWAAVGPTFWLCKTTREAFTTICQLSVPESL